MSHITKGYDITGSYVDLYAKYWRQLEQLCDDELRTEHCEEYEKLTMEEKLLVDIDMEYLKDECDMRYITSIRRKDLEKCLSILRKRDRENGKRNGR